MKNFLKTGLGLLSFLLLFSCSSIKVMSDYDSEVDLTSYKTFAFYRPGIDKLKMSDIDKKRVLRAIEGQLIAKGYQKSSNPDFMINVFTKSKEKINVYSSNYYGYGYYGWNPYYWGPGFNDVNVNQYTEGTLFIDMIDVKKLELFWQGIGTGPVSMEVRDKKEKKINEFVGKILSQYPSLNQ
ncbi:MAG: DUF4136 domain-containing protein [Flavobacteriaceae bacterium]